MIREPNFDNLLAVLRRERPERPTLYEFGIYAERMAREAGPEIAAREDDLAALRVRSFGFLNLGYDYAQVHASEFRFPRGEVHRIKSRSLNEGGLISNRAEFEAYPWPNPDDFDYTLLDRLAAEMPEGARFIAANPGGVLENTIGIVGFDQLCVMSLEDPELTADVFDAVGSRLLRHVERGAAIESVGAIMSNDDWGFRTQTMLSPEQMRRYVFPWHERFVEAAHAAGKPALLHSCGNLAAVMDDVIDGMKFDAKHSYEDTILPVEEAYERWGERIAILGGIDVDFVCRASPGEVYLRSRAMLDRAADRGGYALGTGNSVPDYVPDAHFDALRRAALEAA